MGMNKRYYYKVVKQRFNANFEVEYTSVGWKVNQNKYGIKYKLNEVTKPLIGKLFIFDTLQNAKVFVHRESYGNTKNLKILRIHAKKVSKYKYPIIFQLCCDEKTLMKYWGNDWDQSIISKSRGVPRGTLVADEVLPVDIIVV